MGLTQTGSITKFSVEITENESPLQKLLKLQSIFKVEDTNDDDFGPGGSMDLRDNNIFCISTEKNHFIFCVRNGYMMFQKKKDGGDWKSEKITGASLEELLKKFFDKLDHSDHCDIHVTETFGSDQKRFNFKIKKDNKEITRFQVLIEKSYSNSGGDSY